MDNPHALIVGTDKYFAHPDGSGNVIALTDAAEGVSRTYTYDDWGALTGGSDNGNFAGKDRARFKGAQWVGEEVELYYMRARWYEPKSGRFLSEDPIGLEGGINLYAYAANDPINRSDPTGTGGCPPGSVPTAVMPVVVDGVNKGEHVVCMNAGGEIAALIPLGEYTGTPPSSSRRGGAARRAQISNPTTDFSCVVHNVATGMGQGFVFGLGQGVRVGWRVSGPIARGVAGGSAIVVGAGTGGAGAVGTFVGAYALTRVTVTGVVALVGGLTGTLVGAAKGLAASAVGSCPEGLR